MTTTKMKIADDEQGWGPGRRTAKPGSKIAARTLLGLELKEVAPVF
jgi:hypothetical protein